VNEEIAGTVAELLRMDGWECHVKERRYSRPAVFWHMPSVPVHDWAVIGRNREGAEIVVESIADCYRWLKIAP
jgi:hypothetical protein